MQAVEVVEATIQTFGAAGVPIHVVDLGLGCGVPYLARDKALDGADLREQLQTRWQILSGPYRHPVLQAGRAGGGASGYYLTRVIDKKQLDGETFVFLDGGLNVHNPGVGLGDFCGVIPIFILLRIRFHRLRN